MSACGGKAPLLAQSGHRVALNHCPLSGVKRTFSRSLAVSAFDPNRTLLLKIAAAQRRRPINVRFTPKSGHLRSATGMSALCEKHAKLLP
jgi:hypothetical protein